MSESTYLMIAGGDHTEMRLCTGLDAVRAWFCDMLFGSPTDANQDEIEVLMKSFRDPDNWSDYRWRVQLEDCHLEGTLLLPEIAAPLRQGQRR